MSSFPQINDVGMYLVEIIHACELGVFCLYGCRECRIFENLEVNIIKDTHHRQDIHLRPAFLTRQLFGFYC